MGRVRQSLIKFSGGPGNVPTCAGQTLRHVGNELIRGFLISHGAESFANVVGSSMKERTRDNLIYLGVGLVVVAVAYGTMFYHGATRGTIPEIPDAVLWGTISTLMFFALFLEQFWQERRRRLVWAGCGAVIIGNVCFVGVVFRFWPDIPIVLMAFVSGVLLTLFVTLLRWFIVRASQVKVLPRNRGGETSRN